MAQIATAVIFSLPYMIKYVLTLDLPTTNSPSENMVILVTDILLQCIYFSFVYFSAPSY